MKVTSKAAITSVHTGNCLYRWTRYLLATPLIRMLPRMVVIPPCTSMLQTLLSAGLPMIIKANTWQNLVSEMINRPALHQARAGAFSHQRPWAGVYRTRVFGRTHLHCRS